MQFADQQCPQLQAKPTRNITAITGDTDIPPRVNLSADFRWISLHAFGENTHSLCARANLHDCRPYIHLWIICNF